MHFFKEGYKTAAKAIVSSVKNRWTCQIQDRRLHKKMTFLGLHGVCGVNTISALQIKAKI